MLRVRKGAHADRFISWRCYTRPEEGREKEARPRQGPQEAGVG
jgi:hypothetical protein